MNSDWIVNFAGLVTAAANAGIVATWLGGEQRFPNLLVVFTSGYTRGLMPPTTPRTSFLQKPYTPDDLAATVRRVIDRARTP